MSEEDRAKLVNVLHVFYDLVIPCNPFQCLVTARRGSQGLAEETIVALKKQIKELQDKLAHCEKHCHDLKGAKGFVKGFS